MQRRASQASGSELSQQVHILATGREEVLKINMKPTKKKKEDDLVKPQEKVRTGDGALITNYEVPLEEEEPEIYAGGLKGIRALRKQR